MAKYASYDEAEQHEVPLHQLRPGDCFEQYLWSSKRVTSGVLIEKRSCSATVRLTRDRPAKQIRKSDGSTYDIPAGETESEITWALGAPVVPTGERVDLADLTHEKQKSKFNGGEKTMAKKGKRVKEEKARGHFYEVSAKEPKELGPQAKLVYNAVKAVGPAQQATITEKVGKLKTKQAVEKVVAFYLAQFKKSGFVKLTSAPKAASAAA